MYAVQVRLMKGHCAGVTMEKSMRMDLCFFFFAIRSPNFSSFLFLFPLLFFSSFLCILTTTLFGSCSFGLGRVALSRQCGKMNFLKTNFLRFFRILEVSTVLPIHAGCWPADIHTSYSLCAGVFKCTKPLDILRYTSV